MKVLIVIGLLVIFISAFFVMFIVDEISENNMDCSTSDSGKTVCSLKSVDGSFFMSVIMIVVFAVVDLFVLKLVYSVISRGQTITG